MKIEIKARVTGHIIFSAEAASLRFALEAAVKSRANLTEADLAEADLAGADLAGAHLARADLAGADLAGADLARANLTRAHLTGANLAGAHLARANLTEAHLAGAHLARANLTEADLAGAYLTADLTLKAVFQIGLVDTWPVLLFSTSGGYRLRVGCHLFTLEEAEAHWRGKPDRTGLYYLASEGWKALVTMAGGGALTTR